MTEQLSRNSSTPHDLFRLRTEPQYDFVRDMHETNGLLAELDTKIAETYAENLPDGLGVYEAEAIDVLTRWGADDTTPLVAAPTEWTAHFSKWPCRRSTHCSATASSTLPPSGSLRWSGDQNLPQIDTPTQGPRWPVSIVCSATFTTQ